MSTPSIDTSPIISASFLSGKVKGLYYRGLLELKVYTNRIVVSLLFPRLELLNLPIDRSCQIKEVRNFFAIGIQVRYPTRFGMETLQINSLDCKAWAKTMRQNGINVAPHKGLFDFS
jgi:hypothetical protein